MASSGFEKELNPLSAGQNVTESDTPSLPSASHDHGGDDDDNDDDSGGGGGGGADDYHREDFNELDRIGSVHERPSNDNDHVDELEKFEETNRQMMARIKSHVTDTTVSTMPVPRYQSKPWYKTANPLRWGSTPPVPEERIPSREYQAGLFSRVTFQWMTPLMEAGYKRQLDKQDIWTVNPDRAAAALTVKVREAFQRRRKDGEKNPLLRSLHEVFFFEFWVGGACALVGTLMQVMSPFTLRYLIAFATDAYVAHITKTTPPPIRNGVGLVLGVTFMQVIQSFTMGHFIYRGMMVGGQSRAALINMIYEKSMVISGRAKAGDVKDALIPDAVDTDEKGKPQDGGKEHGKAPKGKKAKKGGKGKDGKPKQDGIGWSNGRIVSLMSIDATRIDQASALFHMIWTAPITCIITLALLLVNLTYSALAGFGLLVVGIPLLTKAIRSLFIRRKAINKITDKRVSLTQEIISSVRFVKFFGWEKAFINRLDEIRSKEIHSIQILLSMRNAINSVSMALPIFASMLSFITYSLSNHGLAPAEVFSSLALFNSLRLPLNLVPMVLSAVIDASSSLQRIEEFLSQEECEEDTIYKPEGEHAVELQSASFTWERTPTQDSSRGLISGDSPKTKTDAKDAPISPAANAKNATDGGDSAATLAEAREPFKLHDLNLQVGRDELVAVIGSVGSGKSSLLAALAGDMRKTSGNVVLGASRAFCPQYAWIQNTSLQNNITFGKEMDPDLYRKVIQACALQADLDMLPNGDQTEIGERGINISGGQKQRINIARAIYFDAPIIFIDDALSAVDAHVGRHIFDNAILGLLKGKCRILATHQLWVLNRCDRIVWMDAGKIQAIDTYENLMRDQAGFRTLMETTTAKKKEGDEGGDDHRDSDDEVTQTKPLTQTETAEKRKAKKNKKAAALMQQEEKAEASIPWSVYTSYCRASGSIWNAPLVILVLVLCQGANIATSLWLSWWTSDKFGMSTGQYIGVYAALGAVQALLMFAFSVMLTVLGTNASKAMLRQAVFRVLRAPMSFFDTTPLGRITNRFSRDVDVMDNQLTDAIRMYFFTLGMVTAVFALIIAYFYWFAIALVPLYTLFIIAAAYYRASAREIKRFESVLRSHVFAKFSEGLTGIASIRAYGLKDRFIKELSGSVDEMNSAYFLTFSNQRWLSLRLDMVGYLLVFTVGILVVTSRFSVNPSIGGLVLSYILSIVQLLQFSIRQLAEVENGMNAVERIRYYGDELEEEAPLHTIDVRQTWPEKGEIVFDNVQMRYRKDTPLVLQGLSMKIKGGERIGIVGRTGAGKSSIMSTLFRLVEISGGSITVDGVNIATIGLFDLRSRLAIIPQDPTLFQGTVRTNLDPFHEHTDLELWSALRQANLIPEDSDINDHKSDSTRVHLDSVVEEEGLNFSLGQRQLLALSRALLKGSRIIICDEATSSVDMETDDKIQKVMATGFRGRTLLCIAHRLHTIIGYDRICVMDAGRIAELDTPLALFKQGGIFTGMCARSGIRAADIERAREQLEALTGPASTEE
ncbi:Oligomycin resistance ATP-dependent permease YOR1 [Escovopsis weberi]|uniref:Oligomycin resistance ATP-dependent permease YOR1 n=1 Tax=Escovopsis weberi TaxID=150374 RepID=A0A0M9VU07_ESCWE|nr:Oligomycin resistance ATP-dependent permease YOR1 [Escovopsis weberi]